MNAGMKMLMLRTAREGDSGRSGGRMEYPTGNYPRMGYDGAEWPESRFRDRSGREHYDNGRFAPMRNDTNIEIEGRFRDDRDRERFADGYGSPMRSGMDDPESRRRRDSRGRFRSDLEDVENNSGGHMGMYPGMPWPVYQERGDRMNQIGFIAGGHEISGEYPMDATYPEREHSGDRQRAQMHGYAMGRDEETMPPMTRELALKWVQSMEGPDGAKGQCWTMEQAAQIMTRCGYHHNPVEWYVVLNMMKRDYAKAAAKMGVDKEDFYAAMADAFLQDADALPGKLMRYYQAVVRK